MSSPPVVDFGSISVSTNSLHMVICFLPCPILPPKFLSEFIHFSLFPQPTPHPSHLSLVIAIVPHLVSLHPPWPLSNLSPQSGHHSPFKEIDHVISLRSEKRVTEAYKALCDLGGFVFATSPLVFYVLVRFSFFLIP